MLDKRKSYRIELGQPGQLHAGVIQPNHSAIGIQQCSQEWNRVQRTGHKTTFGGQCALRPLQGPLRLFLHPHGAVKLQPRNHLARQNLQNGEVLRAELARLAGQDRQRAHNLA
jgi:hypothetical protein